MPFVEGPQRSRTARGLQLERQHFIPIRNTVDHKSRFPVKRVTTLFTPKKPPSLPVTLLVVLFAQSKGASVLAFGARDKDRVAVCAKAKPIIKEAVLDRSLLLWLPECSYRAQILAS